MQKRRSEQARAAEDLVLRFKEDLRRAGFRPDLDPVACAVAELMLRVLANPPRGVRVAIYDEQALFAALTSGSRWPRH